MGVLSLTLEAPIGYRKSIVKAFCSIFLGALLLLVSTCLYAQQTIQATYSNDVSGLRQQIADLVAAEDRKDGQQVEVLLKSLVLAEPSEWVKSNVGHVGKDLAADYARVSKEFQIRVLGKASLGGGDSAATINVIPATIPESLPAAIRRSPSFTVATPYQIEFGPDPEKDSLTATFVFEGGSHRFAGWGIFPLWVKRPEGLSVQGLKVSPPRAIYAPDPDLPRNATRGTQTTVVISCAIGIDGKTHDLKVLSGEPAFREAALDAVRKWRFTPAMSDGKPKEVTITMQVNFRIG